MNNGQKTVLVLLVATLLLEFGSLTKLRRVWSLAFTGQDITDKSATPGGAFGPCPPGSFAFNGFCFQDGTASFPAGPHKSCPAGYQYNPSNQMCELKG